jgi:hypothetical protein
MLAVSVRLFFIPYDLPLTLDAIYYFVYFADTVYLGHLPEYWSPSNNGWPSFLAALSFVIPLDSSFEYMQMQRITAIVLSSATVVPIYLLCKRFVPTKYAVIATTIFVFEPRIISNSVLGLSESSYVFLGAISLLLFLHAERKSLYASFAIAALAILVRGEGLFFFIALSASYFLQNRKNTRVLVGYLPLFAIFVIIVTPMALYRMDVIGTDGILFRTTQSVLDTSSAIDSSGFENIADTFSLFFRYLGWVMIPAFVFFAPAGLYFALKDRIKDTSTMLILLVSMSLPALYAYSIPAQDTRYLYFMYPVFCIFSAIAIKKYSHIIKKEKIFLTIIIASIIIASLAFYEYKKIDYSYEREVLEISKHITETATGINEYYPEVGYILSVQIPSEWPIYFENAKYGTSVYGTDGFDTMEEFLQHYEGKVTHIISDGKEGRPQFIKEIFEDEKKYPYLIKQFDSAENGYRYHVKVFSVDYEILNQTRNN